MHSSRVPSLSLAVARPIITALHFVLCVEDVFGEPRGNGIEFGRADAVWSWHQDQVENRVCVQHHALVKFLAESTLTSLLVSE